jgi:hypothetical protein
MNYLINPDLKPDYVKIKNTFNNIKNTELSDTMTELNVLILNNYNSHSRGDFYTDREKYINRIINVFLIKNKGIKKVVGPIFIDNIKIVEDIMIYINEFVPLENAYIVDHDLELEIANYYQSINITYSNYANVIYE